MTRICSICKQVKTLDRFYPGKTYRGGYRPHCKECAKGFKSQTPEKVLNRVYQTRQRNRQFIWDYYLSHPCVDCGETDPVVLELDHCRGDAKIAGISKMVHNTHSLETIQKEIDKCDVVCANCHRRRTSTSQGWYQGILVEG